MKRLVILLITIVSLGLFSSSAWAIAKDADEGPDFYEYYSTHKAPTQIHTENALKESAKSDWKRIIRSQPEVFDMTIDGKTRECYYEVKTIICE